MAGIDRLLASMGYSPGGTSPNYPQGNRYEMASQALQQMIAQNREKIKKEMDRKQKQATMFKTLRASGYGPQQAWQAIQKGESIPEPGEDFDKDADGTKSKGGLTQMQKDKKRIGRQHVMKVINSWGKTGEITTKDGIPQEIASPDELEMYLINSDLSDYYDLEDKNIQKTLTTAIKKRSNVDLEVEAKKEGKPVSEKIKEFFSSVKDKASGAMGKVKDAASGMVEDIKNKGKSGNMEFKSEQDVYDAVRMGKLKKGDKFIFNGRPAVWE